MSNKPLPKLKHLEYSKTLPLSGKLISFRPYNVGDERILLAAAAAKDDDKNFYIRNTLNVIQGAILNDVNINTLPAVDVRYLLLHQRAKAVGETLEIRVDGKVIEINIDDFKVVNEKTKDDYKIDIGGGFGLLMKDLTFEDEIKASSSIESKENNALIFFEILYNSVKAIYSAEDIWTIGEDIELENAKEFINTISGAATKKIYEFIHNVPTITIDVVIDGKTITLNDRDVDFLDSQSAMSQ